MGGVDAPQRSVEEVAWFSVPQPRQVAVTGKPARYSCPRAKRRCIRSSRHTPSSLVQRVQRHSAYEVVGLFFAAPVELDGAIDVIANGARKRIDLGYIDQDYFANAAAMGMSPLIAETVPHNLKKYLGMLGYTVWAIRVAFKFRPFRLHIDDGKTIHKVWATEARIANGRFHGGGMHPCPRAVMNDGLLEVTTIDRLTAYELVRDLPGEGITMPFMKKVLEGGVQAKLRSTPNPLTPPAWCSIMSSRKIRSAATPCFSATSW